MHKFLSYYLCVPLNWVSYSSPPFRNFTLDFLISFFATHFLFQLSLSLSLSLSFLLNLSFLLSLLLNLFRFNLIFTFFHHSFLSRFQFLSLSLFFVSLYLFFLSALSIFLRFLFFFFFLKVEKQFSSTSCVRDPSDPKNDF